MQLDSRVINDAWIDQSSSMESEVTVGAPLENVCQPDDLDCLKNATLWDRLKIRTII